MTALILALATLIAMFALAALVLRLVDRFRDRPRSPEQVEADRRAYERSLLHPEWQMVAAEFGGTVPAAVESLYRDSGLLLAPPLQWTDEIELASFVPADDNAFDSEQWFDPPPDSFVFAVTASGDPFFVRTSEVAAGLPVYLLHHDGGDVEPLAPSLEEFIGRLRAADGAHTITADWSRSSFSPDS